MHAGQQAEFRVQRTQRVHRAAVEAFALIKHQTADAFFLEVIEGFADHLLVHLFSAVLLDELFADLFLNRLAGGFAGELAGSEQRGNHAVTREGFRIGEDLIRDVEDRNRALGLAGFGDELVLRDNLWLTGFVTKLEGGAEILFADFLRAAFKHHDLGRVADIHNVQIALFALFVGRVGDELAIEAADPNGSERTIPRDVADAERGGCADDAEDVRVILAVRAEHEALYLDFVEPTLGKERADRTIREAASEDFLLGRPAFPFEVTSGEATGGGGFLPIIDGEREEFLPGF